MNERASINNTCIILESWSVENITKILPYLYIDDMFEHYYIMGVIRSQSIDNIAIIIPLLIDEYKKRGNVLNSVTLGNYVSCYMSDMIRYKKLTSDILNLLGSYCTNKLDLVIKRHLKYCIDHYELEHCNIVLKYLLYNGYPANDTFYNDMTLFEYYTEKCLHNPNHIIISLFIDSGGIVTSRIVMNVTNRKCNDTIIQLVNNNYSASSCDKPRTLHNNMCYENLTLKQLKVRAKEYGIKGYSNKRKDELLDLIYKYHRDK